MYIARDRGVYRKGPSAKEKLTFCIERLEAAPGFKNDLEMTADVAPSLTIEEMVGAILHAHDELERKDDELDRKENHIEALERCLRDRTGQDPDLLLMSEPRSTAGEERDDGEELS